VPAGAYNVGAELLALEAGVDAHPARARVHLQQRAWLSLSAARMAGPDDAAADIAVTIEAASPVQRMDLFCRAHGLSPREAELLAAIAKGSDTRELASVLYISQNTVQDHMKSIFAKTGVRNRRALVARALGN
jgi:DNA-binding CsgD family transcriptional regulator